MNGFKAFRRGWLILSLIGMAVAVVMFFVPAHLYMEIRDHEDPVFAQLMWVLLFLLSFFAAVLGAILYTVKTGEESGPLIIRR